MHTRAHIRFHRDRIIIKRVKQYRCIAADWQLHLFEQAGVVRPVGAHTHEQAWMGCGHPRCGCCHPHKRWKLGDRQRAKREWRQLEEHAW